MAFGFGVFGLFGGGYLDADAAVAGVAHDVVDNLGDLLFEFADELLGVVGAVFDVAELLLPDARELAALEELLADESDELDAGGCGDEPFALATDVVALEECLDDAGTG